METNPRLTDVLAEVERFIPDKNGDEFRDALNFLARIAEVGERYEDMCNLMKRLVIWAKKNDKELTVEERNLLSVAYKNIIMPRREAWRRLDYSESQQDHNSKMEPFVTQFKANIKAELNLVCHEVIHTLEEYLIKDNAVMKEEEDSNVVQTQVFYLKMLGDYWRYQAEFLVDDSVALEKAKREADLNYGQAMKLSTSKNSNMQEKLKPTDPIRLGLALNYSVCYYEILKEQSKACDLAKDAFDKAIQQLDTLDETDYKDSTLIMQLLRDNLTLWTSDNKDKSDQLEVQDFDEYNN
jgi:hypothetical protein